MPETQKSEHIKIYEKILTPLSSRKKLMIYLVCSLKSTSFKKATHKNSLLGGFHFLNHQNLSLMCISTVFRNLIHKY